MGAVILPGSYDPVTLGHVDMIRRAAEIYPVVYAVVFINPNKKYFFSEDERVAMLKLACEDIPGVRVDFYAGRVVDYMREHGIESIVKRENYTNAEPRPKSKYIFRETVLVNAADIFLVLGLFCTFGALIAPMIIDFGVDAPMIWAICAAVCIFATTMVSWAILRTLAEISRMLRERSN